MIDDETMEGRVRTLLGTIVDSHFGQLNDFDLACSVSIQKEKRRGMPYLFTPLELVFRQLVNSLVVEGIHEGALVL